MDTQTLIRLVIGLLMTAVVLVFAAKRVLWLTSLIRSGQPTRDEDGRKDDISTRITTQFKEVFGQTRLLRWSIPGIAHFFTMWGFFILASVYLEAYGVLFNPKFAIPFVGHWDALGFLQDFFALAVLLGIVTFADHPVALRAQGIRPRLAVLRLAHRWRLADPVHDLQRHLDLRAVPRSGRGQREPALRLGRLLLPRHGGVARAAGSCQRVHRDRRSAPAHRRHARSSC